MVEKTNKVHHNEPKDNPRDNPRKEIKESSVSSTSKVEKNNFSESSKQSPQYSPKSNLFSTGNIALMILVLLIVVFNQIQINSLTGASLFSFGSKSDTFTVSGGKDLSKLDISTLKSTGHTVAAVFPVENIKTQDDAMAIMFPSGTPDYGQALGVSFDDPVTSLATLANMYRGLQAEVQKNNPQAWQRFITLATKPVGISCEYCCGVGPVGVDAKGNSLCGCQHNPALLSVALYLTAYTDYSDGEILREVMKWKTLFFPKNMIELGLTVAGGDTSKLNLPGMVGGC